jgi:hypothetical protein
MTLRSFRVRKLVQFVVKEEIHPTLILWTDCGELIHERITMDRCGAVQGPSDGKG